MYLQRTERHLDERGSGWRRWFAIGCVLLLVCGATVQVAHSHSEAKTSAHCQICFSIHSALPAGAPSASVTFRAMQDAPAPKILEIAPRFWNCPLANGPPTSNFA